MQKIKIYENIKSVGKQMIKISVIVVAMIVGFFVGDAYHRLLRSSKEKAPLDTKLVNTTKEASIAINEKNELLIINRQNGEYQLYDENVGKIIFKLYAIQMTNQAK